MKSIVCSVAFIALSNFAMADVSDTADKREFFTSAGKCRIAIPKGEFFIVKEQIKPTGATAYYALANEKKLINYSFYLDTNTASCKSSDQCLESVLRSKAYEKAKGLKRYEHSGFSVAEFNIEFPGKDGITIIQKNVLAENVKDGCWIDVHLSQVGVESPDVNNILSVLKDATIQP